MASSTLKPLCFVLMPFGKKRDDSGREIDFDLVYASIIGPAIAEAGLEPLRADEERTGGIIHKPMFERLILCDFAEADLTTANANVFYELGVRHVAKRHTTVLVFHQGGGKMPFDVALLRAMPYGIGPSGQPDNVAADRAQLVDRLRAARQPTVDSPLYQLLEDYPDIAHTKTDVFRDRVAYAQDLKRQLSDIRLREDSDQAKQLSLSGVEASLGAPLDDVEAGVLVDLLLSYRAVGAWDHMVRLVTLLPAPLRHTVLVREQYAFALNRAQQGPAAEQVLLALLNEHGPSSETYGLLGRVYKDRWQRAVAEHKTALAAGALEKAIGAYVRGFEADWRDAYPGTNAVTLMECLPSPPPAQQVLVPVVRYAVQRRIATGAAAYWDHASALELAVLACDSGAIAIHLADALAVQPVAWERATTLGNLALIWTARAARGQASPEQTELVAALGN